LTKIARTKHSYPSNISIHHSKGTRDIFHQNLNFLELELGYKPNTSVIYETLQWSCSILELVEQSWSLWSRAVPNTLLTADMNHLYVKRINLVGFIYIVIGGFQKVKKAVKVERGATRG
jgi:hypothetical protein